MDTYHLHLYKLPHDGSCASASCAEKTVDLPSIFGPSGPSGLIVVTSLAVGVVGGQTLIAVGLSDDGILIFDDNLHLVANIGDMLQAMAAQTPVTALAFGPPSGPGQGGLLAGGVESPGSNHVHLAAQPRRHREERDQGRRWFPDVEMAAAFVQINGQTVAAFTRLGRRRDLVRPWATPETCSATVPVGQRTGQPTGTHRGDTVGRRAGQPRSWWSASWMAPPIRCCSG